MLAMSWHEEKQSAWLYQQVAAVETDARMRQLFIKLAEGAEEQAAIWQPEPKPFTPSARARIVAQLVRLIPPKRMRPVLAAMKLRGLSAYDAAHVREGGHIMPTSLDEVGLSHRGMRGGNLRAAVFGVNDGLVSNTCLIMGVAGAQLGAASSTSIITTGVAGLLAGALSMASGEYLSMRSQREMYEYQIGLEREELAEYPQEEVEELALIYQARGMELGRAREFASELMRDPDHALNVLSREELGLNPDDLGSPWGAAIFSFVSFAAGALAPLLPFLLGGTVRHSLMIAAWLAGTCLVAIGMALSLFTGRGALRGGLRMLLLGGGAGVVTFYLGQWLGAALG
jgi:vacuolar iron transporter family protein